MHRHSILTMGCLGGWVIRGNTSTRSMAPATSQDIADLAASLEKTLNDHWQEREKRRREFPATVNERIWAASDTRLVVPNTTLNPYCLTAILWTLPNAGTLQIIGDDVSARFRIALPSGSGTYHLGADGFIVLPNTVKILVNGGSAGEMGVCLIGHEIPIRAAAGGAY